MTPTVTDRAPSPTADGEASARSVVARAERIAAELPERAREIEAARRLPADLLTELVEIGCFRILVPRSHGGLEGTLDEALRLYSTIAQGDASTGWTVMIGATGWCDFAALPRDTFDALFRGGRDVIVAGAFAPTGSISPVDGGYELTGRWAFASGCEHATTFFANAVESFVDGVPMMRTAVLDPDQVAIEDTWDVVGLRGTGSHHFSASGVVVPPERTFAPLADPPTVDTPIARVPVPSVFALGVAAVATGAARGALDEIVDIAQGKVPLLAPGTLATSPLFHHGLARAETALRAARAALSDAADELWQRAAAGTEATLPERARARSAASWATEVALEATEFAYRAGGGGAVYADSPLQRRLRDVHAVTQHFLVRPDSLATAGAVFAGQPLTVPVF